MPHAQFDDGTLTDTITALTQFSAQAMMSDGLLLIDASGSETDTATRQGIILRSWPLGIAGRQIQLTADLMALAGKGVSPATDITLPTTFVRWLPARPALIALRPLVGARSSHYLLACWTTPELPNDRAETVLHRAGVLFPDLIEHDEALQRQTELTLHLDTVMANVALGIAFLDADGHCRLNSIAGGLLNLPAKTIEAAGFAAAMRETRGLCEIEQSEHLVTQDIYGEVIVPQAEIWILPGRTKVVQVESRATGDIRNPGRFWVFTDITAIWNNGERLRNLNDQLQATNERLESEIIERHRVEQELREREADLQRYAQDLELSRSSIEQQAIQAVEMAEQLAEQKMALEDSKRQSDFLANHDALTGLFNRRAFHNRLTEMLERAKGSNSQVALLFIDLDKFKQVNDTSGHALGDELLRLVASALNNVLRETDLVARFGGDEFAVATRLPAGRDRATLAILAERLRTALQIPVIGPAGTIEVGATIGVTLCPAGTEDIETLLSRADKAMYAGKQRGRNIVVFYEDLPAGDNA